MKTHDWINIRLPNTSSFLRFIAWVIGRFLFSFIMFILELLKHIFQGILTLINWCKLPLIRVMSLYDQLPYAGTIRESITALPQSINEQPSEIITDLVEVISSKQLMIIGEMGTGKSTIAQYLAYTIGGRVKVYECEGTPDDWIGLEVIGKGENWEAINKGMIDDLADLTNQMKLRLERGEHSLSGTDKVIICEEYPELVNKVPSAGEWLERHARRGRKAKRFTILLSQYDRVSAWGLDGKGDLAEAFNRLRLGRKAVAHAKSLKDVFLINWLRENRSHCLLDDIPCKLPSYREMKAVTNRLLPTGSFHKPELAVTTVEQDFENTELSVTDNSLTPKDEKFTIKRAAMACLDAGMSESQIIKEVMGYRGSTYNTGRDLLNRWKGER